MAPRQVLVEPNVVIVGREVADQFFDDILTCPMIADENLCHRSGPFLATYKAANHLLPCREMICGPGVLHGALRPQYGRCMMIEGSWMFKYLSDVIPLTSTNPHFS